MESGGKRYFTALRSRTSVTMTKTLSPQGNEKKSTRVYLRLPVKLRAELWLEGKFFKNVEVADISTTGLSFMIDTTAHLPVLFELILKIGPLQQPIKVGVEKKNVLPCAQGIRVGCKFFEISDENKDLLSSYICKAVSFSGPFLLIRAASALGIIDAAIRILSLRVYYDALGLERNVGVSWLGIMYGCILWLYLVCCVNTFLLVRSISTENDKANFLQSLLSLGLALFFIAVRAIFYLTAFITGINGPYFSFIVIGYNLFAIFVAAAIIIGFASLKKIGDVLTLLAPYRARLAGLVVACVILPVFLACAQNTQGDASSVVEGIFYDERNPVAMIGGKVFRMGDSLCAGKISGISSTAITMQFSDGEREFRVGDGPCRALLVAAAIKQDEQTRKYCAFIRLIAQDFVALQQRFVADNSHNGSIEAFREKIMSTTAPKNCGRYHLLALKMCAIADDGLCLAAKGDTRHSKLFFSRAQRLGEELLRQIEGAAQ